MNKSIVGKTTAVFLGALIVALGLYLFLKGVDIRKLARELQSFSGMTIALVCGLIVLSLYLRALRWKYMLPDEENALKDSLFSNVAIGFMFNNLFPARIGEFARAFILWKKNRYPLAVACGTLVVERVIDTMVFLLFFVVPAFILPQCAPVRFFAAVAAGVIVAGILFVFFYMRFQAVTGRIVLKIISKLPERFENRTIQVFEDLSSALEWIRTPARAAIVLTLSLLTVLCYPAMIIALARDIQTPFGLLEGMFAQAYASFGAAIPLAPGFIGTVHAVMLQGLNTLGMDTDRARALVIVYHALNYVLVTPLGLYLFFKLKLSFKEITAARQEAR